MTIEYMLIVNADFDYSTVIYLMSLKAFNGGNTSMRESKYGIIISCNFKINKRELNKLRSDIKENTGAKYVDCRINEK